MREQHQVARFAGIRRVGQLEGARVALALQRIDVRMESAVGIEPVDRLRRDVAARGLGVEWRRVGQHVGEHRDQVEQADDHRADHRQPVLAEAPPDELALGGDGDAGFRLGDEWFGR